MEAVRRAEAKHGPEALDREEEAWVRRVTEGIREAAPSGRPGRGSVGTIKGYEKA